MSPRLLNARHRKLMLRQHLPAENRGVVLTEPHHDETGARCRNWPFSLPVYTQGQGVNLTALF